MVDEAYERARRRVTAVKGFYNHIIIFLIINILLAAVNFLISPGFLWFFFVTFFWGIGLVMHGLSVFMKRGLFSKDWEERKIKEYMEDEEK